MSDFSLTLVLQIKTSKIINDRVKSFLFRFIAVPAKWGPSRWVVATLIRIFNKFYIRSNIIIFCIIQTFPKNRYMIMNALYHNISIRRLMY